MEKRTMRISAGGSVSAIIVSELYTYPVKSMRAVRANTMTVGHRGPLGDRCYMLIDWQQQFVTQRAVPRMTLLSTQLTDHGLVITNTEDTLTIERPLAGLSESVRVQIWDDQVDAIDCGDEAALWLSAFLLTEVRLVFLPPESLRLADPSYARSGSQVGFADGFPFLLISQASLDDLNSRLPQPISMRRFRPNIVVQGCEAFAEDNWQQVRMGDVVFDVVKPCSRCVIPSIDPDTGEKDSNIVRVLASFRRREDKKTYFGQNLVHQSEGLLKVGDELEVIRLS